MSFAGWCKRCQAEGIRSPVRLLHINLSEAVYMCPRPECLDILEFAENPDALFINREPSVRVTKAPAPKPIKAVQSSSLLTACLPPSSGPAPLPTEGGPLSRALGDQDAAREPAAHPFSKVEAVDSSVRQMASTSNNEAKAGDASEVCRGGKMLAAEAVTSPVPTGVEPFFHSSVVPTMPVACATGAAEKELSLLHAGSADVAGNALEQSEPCRENAPPPPAESHASGERSSLPVATCGGSEGEVEVSARLEGGEVGTTTNSTWATPVQGTSKEEGRRDGKCGGAVTSWMVRGAEKRSSQVQVAALVSGDNSVPSTVHTAPNEASEQCAVAAVHGDSDSVALQEPQACVEKGMGHHCLPGATSDLSVSSRVDAGECNSEVSAEDPIVSSLRIAETMFSLHCSNPQVSKPSVDGGDSTAAWSQPQGASGVQFDRTEDAFRDDRPSDCMEIEEVAHQSQSQVREYVDLRPRSPPLLAPSQGAPSSLQAAAVIGSSAAPAQKTPAAVASTSGNAAVTRRVPGRASTGKAAAEYVLVAGTSSGSGRLACKPEVRTPRSGATSGRGAAASDPARPTKTRQKRRASPPRPQAEATMPANESCYVVHRLAMIAAALKPPEDLPTYALPRENKIENQRLPGRKRKKDARTKRQAGPQSSRPASPKKVLRLAFGRPPKIRRKRQPEQVVPGVLQPAPSPTPSDNSSQSTKPSIKCPSCPATTCMSSGSDLSTTNPGSSGASSSSSSLQLVKDYYARQSTATASGFPPYQFTEEIAPVTGAKRGRRPAKKGTVDVGAEVDRYVRELSACEDSSQYDSLLADLF